VDSAAKLRWIAFAALAALLGCQRCGASSLSPSSADAAASDGSPPAAPEAAADGGAHEGPPGAALDVPEIRDPGTGRATAALRAVLQAYGIAFDAAAIEKECKVDDDGASIDDLEDVADNHGLDAEQVIVPAEHVLIPEADMLPAIVVVDGADDMQDFVVAWRLDGDRVEVMSPVEGRAWLPRAELRRRLHVHEQTMPAADLRSAMGTAPYRGALRARLEALGVPRAAAEALVDRAAGDPGFRGFAALDAAIRQAEGEPARAAGDVAARLSASFDCASGGRCDGVVPIPAALWSAEAAPDGPDGPEARVRGVVLLAIEGKKAPVAGDAGGG
jgi:hypothetical protein